MSNKLINTLCDVVYMYADIWRRELQRLPRSKFYSDKAISRMAFFYTTLLLSLLSASLFSTRVFAVDDIEQYLEELQRAEVEYGAYDQSLADAYLGLGAAYEANQELNEAADAYLRGMHVQRVNNGLFDPGQVVYLEELAELEVGRSNWFDASGHLKTAHAITAKNNSPGSLPVLKAASQLIDLHLKAHAVGAEDWDKHLERADALNQKQFRGVGWSTQDIDFTVERMQRTAYINYESYKVSDSQTKFERRNSRQQPFSSQQQSPTLFPFFRQGKLALENNVYALRDSNADPKLLAHSLAEVGDWYSLFDRGGGARAYYQKAFEIYATSAGEEAATKEFSEPLQIPIFGVEGKESVATKKFEYSLNVTATGRTSDVKLITDKEGFSVRDIRRAFSTVRSLRFRPVLTKDGPITKLDNTLSVRLE